MTGSADKSFMTKVFDEKIMDKLAGIARSKNDDAAFDN